MKREPTEVEKLRAEVLLLREKARDAVEYLEDLEASDNEGTQPGTLQGDTFLVVLAGLRIALDGHS